MSQKRVLILGASGRSGRHAAHAFAERGWEVRAFRRDQDDVRTAAEGCQVVVNAMNPPNYHDWDRQLPKITALAIEAARAANATLIVPGNVYNYGSEGGTWSAATPHVPCSRKGRLRVEAEETYRKAGVRTIILRAGNFIDPDRQGDIMSLLLKKAHKGKLMRLGEAEIDQAWAYLPDWARAAAMLADLRDQLGDFEDVPFPGHTFSYEDLRAHLQARLDRKLSMSLFPWWLMRVASPVWELAREMSEMRYLSQTPHRLDGDKFARLLPDFVATDTATVMEAALPTAA